MTAISLNQEFGMMRLRFQRTMMISVGLHVLFSHRQDHLRHEQKLRSV